MAKKKLEKQILRLGKWLHPSAPNGVLDIDSGYIKRLVQNFQHSPFAPVLRGHAEQSDADANPELISAKNIDALKAKEDGLYAEFEIEEAELEKYNDVSVSIEPDYVNHETGESIGPLLKHVALVTNPFIKGLKQFVALSDKPQLKIYLSEIHDMEEQVKPDQAVEEVIAEVATETVVEETTVEAVTDVVADTVEETVITEPTAEVPAEATTEEVVEEAAPEKSEAVNASELLLERIAALEATNKQLGIELSQSKAEKMFDNLLTEGKLVPAQRQAFIELAAVSSQSINLADGTASTVENLLTELFKNAPKVISFGEQGVNTEAGDGIAESIPGSILQDLKKVLPEKTDAELAEYANKNSKTLLEAYKAKKK